MKKTNFLLVCLLVAAFAAPSKVLGQQVPIFEWVQRIGQTGTEISGSIETDIDGNSYVTGFFTGQMIFGNDTLNAAGPQIQEAFIVKVSNIGTQLWAKKLPLFNPLLPEPSSAKIVIANGKIFVGANVPNQNIWVFTPNGAMLAHTEIASVLLKDFCVDGNNTVYSVGNRFPNIENGYTIAKSAPLDGTTEWSYSYSSTGSSIYNITLYEDTVRIVGQFNYQITLADTLSNGGGTPITFNATDGLNDWDFFQAKYSTDGKLLGGIQTVGIYLGLGGPYTYCTGQYNLKGEWTLTWVRDVSPYEVRIKKFSRSMDGPPSVTSATTSCFFDPTVVYKINEFDQTQAVFSYYGFGCVANAAYRVDTAGVLLGDPISFPFVGPSNYRSTRALSLDSAGDIYVTTGFKGSLQYFDSNSNVVSLNSTVNSEDIYIAKLHQCPDYNYSLGFSGEVLTAFPAGLKYQWYKEGILIPGATNDTYTPVVTGDYSVIINAGYGCGAPSGDFHVDVVVGIEEIIANGQIAIFPNPAHDEIKVTGVKGEITIFSIEGKKMLSTVISEAIQNVNVSKLPPGMYIVELSSGDFITRVKIIKS